VVATVKGRAVETLAMHPSNRMSPNKSYSSEVGKEFRELLCGGSWPLSRRCGLLRSLNEAVDNALKGSPLTAISEAHNRCTFARTLLDVTPRFESIAYEPSFAGHLIELRRGLGVLGIGQAWRNVIKIGAATRSLTTSIVSSLEPCLISDGTAEKRGAKLLMVGFCRGFKECGSISP